MNFIKENAIPLAAVALLIIAAVYSLEAALVFLSGIASALFGSNRRKTKELSEKAELIQQVESEKVAVKAELAAIDKRHAKELDELVASSEEDIDSWLDQ